MRALEDVKRYGNLPIPLNLRNAPTKLMKELGYGKGYEKYPDKSKSLLPEKIRGRKYDRPILDWSFRVFGKKLRIIERPF